MLEWLGNENISENIAIEKDRIFLNSSNKFSLDIVVNYTYYLQEP